MSTPTPNKHAASFRDPSGFLFSQNGILYRQINQIYRGEYDLFLASGLYENLTKAGLLIAHQEAGIASPAPSIAYKVIQPEALEFISYPYEWSFSQLKDAALATLSIQKRALKFGLSLKDSSAYNIQFHARTGKPVLIDSLSFERYEEGRPWVAYRQFCQHFLAPLALMAYTDARLSQLLRVFIDGVPLDLASRLLPRRTRFNFGLLSHIHLHAAAQIRYAGKAVDKEAASARSISKTAFLGLIDSLERTVKKLIWKPAGTEWGAYYQDTNYTNEAMQHKQTLVAQFLDQIKPRTVWDLGANIGVFSRLTSKRGALTISFDVDPAAVEKNYLEMKANRESNLLPLVLDLTNPSPALGWDNRERSSLGERGPADAALALALVHHLAISNNVPLPLLADFFASVTRWLVVEFIPKSDSQVQRLLAARKDIFIDYHQAGFEEAFSVRFQVHAAEDIKGSLRRLYLMEKKTNR